MFRILKWLGYGVLLIVVVAAVRILTYSQSDDSGRVEQKMSYLQSLGDLEPAADRPNIVLILFDDMGYGDLGAYGSQAIKTPNMDALANGGVRFSNYYSPSPVCTPSRAGMLTGRYAPRAGLSVVAFPDGSLMSNVWKLIGSNIRIPYEEILLPEVLQAVGYQTAMVGKWHLGDEAPSLPNSMGFDYWYGSPYSNDMSPFAIYRNDQVIVEDLKDQSGLNAEYVREATEFIRGATADNQLQAPFFLYFAHSFPHIPLFSSAQQQGQSVAGLYGDVVEDLDRGVGEVLQALRESNALENTLVILTSDNGPWYQGSPGPNRGRKGKSFDGGQNVPFISYWPDQIAPGQQSEVVMSGVDVMPSILSLLNIPEPTDRIIDGEVRVKQLLGAALPEDQRLLYYFRSGRLESLRDSRFKYQSPIPYPLGLMDNAMVKKGPFLFDFLYDENESYDTSGKNEKRFQALQAAFDSKLAEMSDNPRGWLPSSAE